MSQTTLRGGNRPAMNWRGKEAGSRKKKRKKKRGEGDPFTRPDKKIFPLS